MPRSGFFTPTPQRLRWALLIISLLMLPLAWRLFGPRGVIVEAQRKTWHVEVEIEKHVLESASGWCDELPPGALDISRRLLSDPSGARAAPAEHCRYSLPTWRKRRVALASGDASEAPRWPELHLSGLPPEQLGAERAGRRQTFYEVELGTATGPAWTCRLPPAEWQALRTGSRFRLQVDRQGVADCASRQAL